MSAKQQIVALAMKIAAKKVDDRFSSLRFCSFNNRKFETAVNTIIYCNRLYYQQFFPNSKTDVRLIVFLVKTYVAEMIYKISAWRVKKQLLVNRVARVYTAQKHVVGR